MQHCRRLQCQDKQIAKEIPHTITISKLRLRLTAMIMPMIEFDQSAQFIAMSATHTYDHIVTNLSAWLY